MTCMKTITICSSAAFYRQVVDAQSELLGYGYKVLIPETAEKMKKSGNFDVSQVKTWFNNAEDYYKKSQLIKGHFKEIEKADIILILNFEKNGKTNYIGGNVLMEMAVGFYLNKPIYLLNDAPEDSTYIEEILGMQPIFLKGDLVNLSNLA